MKLAKYQIRLAKSVNIHVSGSSQTGCVENRTVVVPASDVPDVDPEPAVAGHVVHYHLHSPTEIEKLSRALLTGTT